MLRHDPPLPTDRDGFRFRGGHMALDLTATLAGRAKAQPRELLAQSSDLLRWLGSAGLPADHAREADLHAARDLREAIYALALARIGGTDAPEARERINRVAAGTPAVPRLDRDGAISLGGPAEAMLAMIARETIFLFGSDRAAQIRQCQADVCTLLFVDTSRRSDRRWCSMAGCGNRAKLAEFRRRRRQAP
jgi:predicted RNA-binding Zn ribbon-like protein